MIKVLCQTQIAHVLLMLFTIEAEAFARMLRAVIWLVIFHELFDYLSLPFFPIGHFLTQFTSVTVTLFIQCRDFKIIIIANALHTNLMVAHEHHWPIVLCELF